MHLHWKLSAFCQIYTVYILKHYFKPKIKTDNSEFTKFGMKIGPVPDLQEFPDKAPNLFWLLCLEREVRYFWNYSGRTVLSYVMGNN